MKPYYDRDGITIYCGECSQVMKLLISEKAVVDLTVTSPPYDNLRNYQGYVFPFKAIATGLWGITTVGGVVVWVVGDQTIDGSETGTSFRQALYFKAMGFKLHDTMIYEVEGTGAKGSNKAYWQGFEFMFILAKEKIKSYNLIKDKKNVKAGCLNGHINKSHLNGTRKERGIRRVPTYSIRSNVWRYPVGGKNRNDNTLHPAIFPEALARDHIISWSNEGDLIFDPMMGSGTTLKMAQQLGRRAIGIDISEEYCKIAVERLRQPSFFSIPAQQDKPKPIQGSLIDD